MYTSNTRMTVSAADAVATASEKRMIAATHLTHLVQHLYIGAGPLLFPLVMSDMDLTYTLIGFVISVRTIFAGFFQVFYGYLRRLLSRRVMLNGSNLISVLSSIGMGVSAGFSPFLFWNILWGLSTSPVHPIGGSLMADESQKNKKERKGINIGLFYSFAYVGNLIGAVMVLLLVNQIGWQGVFFTMGLLTLPVLFYGLVISDEAPAERTEKMSQTDALTTALMDSRVVLTCLVGILFFGGTNIFIRHLAPLYLTNQLDLPIGEASLIFISISVIGIFSPPIFVWLSKRLNRKMVLISIALLLAAAFAYLPYETRLTYTAVLVLGILAFFSWPLLALFQAFLISILEPKIKGAGANLLLTVNICSFVLWASLFGVLIDIDGSFDGMFYGIAILCLGSIPLMLLVKTGARQPN